MVWFAAIFSLSWGAWFDKMLKDCYQSGVEFGVFDLSMRWMSCVLDGLGMSFERFTSIEWDHIRNGRKWFRLHQSSFNGNLDENVVKRNVFMSNLLALEFIISMKSSFKANQRATLFSCNFGYTRPIPFYRENIQYHSRSFICWYKWTIFIIYHEWVFAVNEKISSLLFYSFGDVEQISESVSWLNWNEIMLYFEVKKTGKFFSNIQWIENETICTIFSCFKLH